MKKNMMMLAYGDSQVGKTRLAAIMASLYKDKYPDKSIKLVSAENVDPFVRLIKDGTVDYWPIQERFAPWEAITGACRGLWPLDPFDPRSKATRAKDVSLWIIEGIASFCQIVMGDSKFSGLAAKTGRGEHVGPVKEGSIVKFDEVGTLEEGKAKFSVGFNNRNHYNYTQSWIMSRLEESKALGTDVIWTTHLCHGEANGVYVFGPHSTGKAIVYEIPKKFGPLIFLKTQPGEDGKPIYIAHTKEFWSRETWEDDKGHLHSQKVRVMASLRPPVGQEDMVKDSYIANGAGIREIVSLIEQFNQGD